MILNLLIKKTNWLIDDWPCLHMTDSNFSPFSFSSTLSFNISRLHISQTLSPYLPLNNFLMLSLVHACFPVFLAKSLCYLLSLFLSLSLALSLFLSLSTILNLFHFYCFLILKLRSRLLSRSFFIPTFMYPF